MPFANSIFVALLGGILPALFWLFFWLKEDEAHPEPRKRILEAFLAGMACTILVIPLELFTSKILVGQNISLYVVWAIIEESVKLAVCYFVAIRTKDDDEPIDAVIYMIITALGFAALENSLFILDPLIHANNIFGAFVTGNMRFVGATLLHVLSSSVVGIFMAFAFYKNSLNKKVSLIIGLFFAILIHILFNVFIAGKTNGSNVLIIFSLIWWGIIALIVILEKIKILGASQPYALITHSEPPIDNIDNKYGTINS